MIPLVSSKQVMCAWNSLSAVIPIKNLPSAMAEAPSSWSVYILRDETNALYVGITTDIDRRFQEHVSGGARSAKYTRSKKQLELVYSCRIGSRSLASKVEYRLKRCAKREKEAIVEQALEAEDLFVSLGLPNNTL